MKLQRMMQNNIIKTSSSINKLLSTHVGQNQEENMTVTLRLKPEESLNLNDMERAKEIGAMK